MPTGNAARSQIGVSRAIVLGHSWGTLVAVALALQYPRSVQSLILASGYYYPTVRADTLIFSAPSIPVLGDFMKYTLSSILSRLMWPLLLRKLFGPNPVPPKFEGFPKEMAVRPSQIRAGAAEAALMIRSVHNFGGAYAKLQMPVAIIAGSDDRLIEPEQSSQKLKAAGVDRETRSREGASDHAPVWAELQIKSRKR
jgi:pimeloyl-ACP methyl ester carboxylesterase